jgi:hypothetical protein
MSTHVQRNRNARLNKLRKTAKAYGLLLVESGALLQFKKDTGEKHTVYGIWAAEMFLEGFIFATRQVVPVEKTGLWKDEDEDDDEDSW